MSAEAISGMSGAADPQGTNDALAFQRDEYKEAPKPTRTLNVPWTERRARYGKLNHFETCAVCGRRLCVNWVRAYPCLWCDETVAQLKEANKEHDGR